MLHLTVSLAGAGFHPAAWRVSRLPVGPNAAATQRLARAAERGKLDAVLLGLPAEGAGILPLDPLPLLGSLIGVTRQIGLGAVWAVDYTEPFHIARVFATLDHLSFGRAAWVVGLFEAERLMPRVGREPQASDTAEYCRRAGEFVEIVRKLWDSWEDAALALDKPSGTFVKPERVHPIEHAGRFFAVRGPLNVPRPPQGNPVLIMSDPPDRAAREFAAATADVMLISCHDLREARERCRELRALAPPGAERRILANIDMVLRESEAAASRRAAELDAMLSAPGGGLRFIGTPSQLVELMALWQQEGACDGFNLLPAVLDDLDLFIDQGVPLGQARGLFRTNYTGAPLREHLGLPRPPSQYEAAAQ